MRFLLGIWTWFSFALVSTVGFVICLVVFLLTRPFDPTRRWIGRAIRLTGRVMCACVPAWRFSVRGPVPEPLPPRVVCVCNHMSNIDPFLLTHVPWEMKYLAKASLFRIPMVGWGIGLAGDIPLVRGSASSVKRALARAAWYVERGMPVLFFPEGTRSPDGQLLPFKDGAFRLAIETGAHVLPLALAGTADALRKGDWKPSPAHGVVVVGQPIDASGRALPELKEEVRSAIAALVQTISVNQQSF